MSGTLNPTKFMIEPKKRLNSLKMYLVGMLLSNEKILGKMGNKMNEGMLAPYKKLFAEMDKEEKGR